MENRQYYKAVWDGAIAETHRLQDVLIHLPDEKDEVHDPSPEDIALIEKASAAIRSITADLDEHFCQA